MAMPADPHRSMMNVFLTYASSTPYHESPYSPVHRCAGFEASGKAQPVVCFQLFTWHTLFRNASQCNSDARSKPVFIHLILLLYDSLTSSHYLSPDLHLSLSHPRSSPRRVFLIRKSPSSTFPYPRRSPPVRLTRYILNILQLTPHLHQTVPNHSRIQSQRPSHGVLCSGARIEA